MLRICRCRSGFALLDLHGLERFAESVNECDLVYSRRRCLLYAVDVDRLRLAAAESSGVLDLRLVALGRLVACVLCILSGLDHVDLLAGVQCHIVLGNTLDGSVDKPDLRLLGLLLDNVYVACLRRALDITLECDLNGIAYSDVF